MKNLVKVVKEWLGYDVFEVEDVEYVYNRIATVRVGEDGKISGSFTHEMRVGKDSLIEVGDSQNK